MAYPMECFGLPTMIRVTFRCLANLAISSAMLRPGSVTASAPRSAAKRKLSAAWVRAASGSITAFGCSTYATNHSARPSAAIFLAALISRAEEELGLTHTRSRSSVGPTVSAIVKLPRPPQASTTSCLYLKGDDRETATRSIERPSSQHMPAGSTPAKPDFRAMRVARHERRSGRHVRQECARLHVV